jgi:hypothetical protein
VARGCRVPTIEKLRWALATHLPTRMLIDNARNRCNDGISALLPTFASNIP